MNEMVPVKMHEGCVDALGGLPHKSTFPGPGGPGNPSYGVYAIPGTTGLWVPIEDVKKLCDEFRAFRDESKP